MTNVPFVPRSRAGRKIHNLARRHVRDDHDLRAAVHRALAERRSSTESKPDNWERPALDRRRRVTPPTLEDQERNATMQPINGTPADVPTPLQDRRWLRESLKLVAAAIVIVLVGAILVLLLRDNDPSDQPSIPGEAPPEVTATTLVSPTSETPATQTSPTVDATAAQLSTRQASQGAARQALTATAVSATATTSASATANASLPLPGEVDSTIQVGSNPTGLAVADGSLWVGNAGDGTLMRIDPETNAVEATIEIGTPGQNTPTPFYVVSYNDQIWVTDDTAKAVLQIDPGSNTVVKTIPLVTADGAGSFQASGLVVDDTGVWISDYRGGRLLNFDPATGAVLSITDIVGPQDLTSGFGALWIDAQGIHGASILRFDTSSKQILNTIVVTGMTAFVTTGADAVWATDELSGTVTRIDPTTNSVTATIDTGLREARCILVAYGNVWVNGWLGAGFDNGMVAIDPAINALSRYIDTVPGIGWFMAEFDGSLWVAHADTNEVERIDPTP